MKAYLFWIAFFFFLGTLSCLAGMEAYGGSEMTSPVPGDCAQYKGTARYETCQHAREFGLTMHAAELVEGLAEHDHAVTFCGGTPDPDDIRHTESILAGGDAYRALYKAHRGMLETRCVYDPDGWCRSMGLERR